MPEAMLKSSLPRSGMFTIRNGTYVFSVLIALCVIVPLGLSFHRDVQGQIGSANYYKIITAKDVIADVLPPPSFIIEAYLALHVAAELPGQAQPYIGEYEAHKALYFKQLEFWKSADISDDVRRLLTVDSPAILEAFWAEADKTLIPLLQTATSDPYLIGASMDRLTSLFKQHKAVVDQVVKNATEDLTSMEADVKKEVSGLRVSATIIGCMALLVIAVLLRAVSAQIVQPLRRISAFTSDPANMQSGGDVPYMRRRDEIGELSRSFADLRVRLKEIADAEAEERQATTRTAIDQLRGGLSRLAQGDLTTRIDNRFCDELDQLREDFNTACVQIGHTFNDVIETARNLNNGVKEIVSASDNLSRRTERQANALEETVEALGGITEALNKSNESLAQTRTSVGAARSDAEASEQVLAKALASMADIERSAREIGKIISVIDEIAFQTNLLALNAGVEAARAGDAGQGFAVVAAEVRALAQRSARAAKEIKELIAKSSDEVASGTRFVGDTGATLQRMSGRVVDISDAVETVALRIADQSAALKQLNATAGEMDTMTQQNAAMAEQATASCHSLAQEADRLLVLVDGFRLRGAPRAGSAVADMQSRIRDSLHRPRAMSAQGGGGSPRTVGNAALDENWQSF